MNRSEVLLAVERNGGALARVCLDYGDLARIPPQNLDAIYRLCQVHPVLNQSDDLMRDFLDESSYCGEFVDLVDDCAVTCRPSGLLMVAAFTCSRAMLGDRQKPDLIGGLQFLVALGRYGCSPETPEAFRACYLHLVLKLNWANDSLPLAETVRQHLDEFKHFLS